VLNLGMVVNLTSIVPLFPDNQALPLVPEAYSVRAQLIFPPCSLRLMNIYTCSKKQKGGNGHKTQKIPRAKLVNYW